MVALPPREGELDLGKRSYKWPKDHTFPFLLLRGLRYESQADSRGCQSNRSGFGGHFLDNRHLAGRASHSGKDLVVKRGMAFAGKEDKGLSSQHIEVNTRLRREGMIIRYGQDVRLFDDALENQAGRSPGETTL